MTEFDNRRAIHKIALVYLEETEGEYKVEMVNANRSANNLYQITSAPFFAKHLAVNDCVTVEDEDGTHFFDSLIHKSGHSTIRILFEPNQEIDNILKSFHTLGVEAYRYHDTVLAVLDIPPSADYQIILKLLQTGEAENQWEFEESCLGWK